MANRDNRRGFWLSRTLTGQGARLERGYLSANVACAHGDALYATTGYLRTTVTTDKAIIGFATENVASSSSNLSVSFVPAFDGYIFAGQCSGTPTQALMYTLVDIEGTANGSAGVFGYSIQEINENASSVKNIYLVNHDPEKSSMGLNAILEFVVARNKFTAKPVLSIG